MKALKVLEIIIVVITAITIALAGIYIGFAFRGDAPERKLSVLIPMLVLDVVNVILQVIYAQLEHKNEIKKVGDNEDDTTKPV